MRLLLCLLLAGGLSGCVLPGEAKGARNLYARVCQMDTDLGVVQCLRQAEAQVETYKKVSSKERRINMLIRECRRLNLPRTMDAFDGRDRCEEDAIEITSRWF